MLSFAVDATVPQALGPKGCRNNLVTRFKVRLEGLPLPLAQAPILSGINAGSGPVTHIVP